MEVVKASPSKSRYGHKKINFSVKVIDAVTSYLCKVNTPTGAFNSVQEYFQLNFDESCFICNDGVLKIIGNKDQKRHDKNASDNCVSISVVRSVNTEGNNGPVIFIGSDQMDKFNRIFSFKRMTKYYVLPPGSCVLLNKNAYMDNDTWVEVVRRMAPGIRQMPIIKEYPDWQAFLTFDGFKSHVN